MTKNSDINWTHHLQSLSEQLQTFQSLTNQLSKQTSSMDQWLQILGHFSTALQDQDKRNKMASALSKINQDDNPSSPTGDMMYDLFNSPNMIKIVKETMHKKRKF